MKRKSKARAGRIVLNNGVVVKVPAGADVRITITGADGGGGSGRAVPARKEAAE